MQCNRKRISNFQGKNYYEVAKCINFSEYHLEFLAKISKNENIKNLFNAQRQVRNLPLSLNLVFRIAYPFLYFYDIKIHKKTPFMEITLFFKQQLEQ